MIYPSDFEKKIGFLHLRSLLCELCLSKMGRDRVDALSFKTDFKLVTALLQQTAEMKRIIESHTELPLGGMHDVIPYLNVIKSSGSFLSASRLLELVQMLREIDSIHQFFNKGNETEKSENDFPALRALFKDVLTFSKAIREIDRVVNKFGEVKDDASPELFDLRNRIRHVQASMSSVMRKVIDRAVHEGIIEKDTTPSVRDGRLVIPVSSGNKRELSGIVHDESSTGKTVYIEPTEVVRTANQLRVLEMEEQREVTAILMSVAEFLRPEIDAMVESCRMVGLFDFIHAKALLAIKLGCEMPVLEKKPELDWFHAVHPVLKLTLESQGREVVPLSINLNNKNRILVISGPNAGGKSVCLKTVGIIQYMMQCGLLPTLYSNSHAGVFRNLFIDIGDEQSIENDLSTYSSHLKNMKHFLRYAGKDTLFLADEMGSGTEPQIGGALAQAILKVLNEKKAFGIVTTHYQNLKVFAENEEGMMNGAMLYDRVHLQPLFQLAIGSPGSSFALEIARKTGLDSSILDMAKEIVGSDYVNQDRYMLDIARDRRYWSNKRLAIREKERKLEDVLKKTEERAEQLREQRSEILRQAKQEAKEIMEGANARLENVIHEIRKSQAEKERTKAVRIELENYKKELKKDSVSTAPSILRSPKKNKPDRKNEGKLIKPDTASLDKGDYVKMADGGVTGQILSISGKQAEVAFGDLRTFVALNKLKPALKPKPKATETVLSITKSTSEDSRKRQLNFSQEIDVRGMRADEALQAVTYFIDDAIQFSASRVRILHGTGGGILRQVLREYLKTNPNVVSAEDEDVRFGGAGITVVTLR